MKQFTALLATGIPHCFWILRSVSVHTLLEINLCLSHSELDLATESFAFVISVLSYGKSLYSGLKHCSQKSKIVSNAEKPVTEVIGITAC